MIPGIRSSYNEAFSEKTYQAFLSELHSVYPGAIEFRVAETPVFIPRGLGREMIDTCTYIIDQICAPDFINKTHAAIPPGERVPGDIGHPHFLAFDFGICTNESGQPVPRLIEMQGFPSLFGFQAMYPEILARHVRIPDGFSHYFGGLDKSSFLKILKDVIVGDADPEEVILLEIDPDHQKTRVDFYATRDYLGIRPVCITKLIEEGDRLYYEYEGRRIRIRRIYNRLIFDELNQRRASLGNIPDLSIDRDVQWITHPDWFYRISKYTLPFIKHACVPETRFLSELQWIPDNLADFVLKPLFSFAGQGVVIDVTPEDIAAVEDPAHWILQRKETYADIIATPDGPAKVEVRLMYVWKEGDTRPTLVTNLARISKGKMVGVRYNQDKTWVGGSVAYFEI
ncbi:MAG: hypothetical protein ACK5VH_09250 [bacterium]